MNPSENAFNLARKFEGCKLNSYQDSAGVWTIGYGHTAGVKSGDTCTQDQAEEWLKSDMLGAAMWVSRLVTADIDQNQFDALCDFVFNLGPKNLETSHLLKYVNARQFEAAANEFGKWVHAGGKVLGGLVARRQAEKQLFTGGKYESLF